MWASQAGVGLGGFVLNVLLLLYLFLEAPRYEPYALSRLKCMAVENRN